MATRGGSKSEKSSAAPKASEVEDPDMPAESEDDDSGSSVNEVEDPGESAGESEVGRSSLLTWQVRGRRLLPKISPVPA